MKKKNLKICILANVMLLSLLLHGSPASEMPKSFTIAISPCTDVVSIYEKFHPLIAYLQEKTGCGIELAFPDSYQEFEKVIRNKDIDFAFQDPDVYLKFTHLYNKKSLVMAVSTKGELLQTGVVIARKDADIRRIEDLVGRRVIFGPRLSSTRWVKAKLLFAEKGVNIDRDLSEYSNGGCCEDIAFNVHLKATDAGVVCEHFLAEHEKKQQDLGVETQEIRVIDRTKSVPTRVFAARLGVSDTLVNKVNQALLSLVGTNPEHSKILYRAEVGGFRKVGHEEYAKRCTAPETLQPDKRTNQ